MPPLRRLPIGIWPHNGATISRSVGLYAPGIAACVHSTDARGEPGPDVESSLRHSLIGLPNAFFRGPMIDSSGAIYLLNDSGILLRSTDNGVTWVTNTGPWSNAASGQGVRLLALDPVSPSSTIYVSFPAAWNGLRARFRQRKLDPAGSIVLGYDDCWRDRRRDQALAIAVDSAGNAYVAGTTNSLDFPVVQPRFQAFSGKAGGNGIRRLFSPRYRSDGSKLLYSTYLGAGPEMTPRIRLPWMRQGTRMWLARRIWR